MDLGWLDLCLTVEDVVVSREFYESLGFHKVEGKDEEAWAVMVNGDTRIGLYGKEHMGDGDFCLNFRGGHVGKIVQDLEAKGHKFEPEYKVEPDSPTGTAFLKDPDGYVLMFDHEPGETKKV